MLRNPYDKNGNRLKGATVITRFVKENDGIPAIVTKSYDSGYDDGHTEGYEKGKREGAIRFLSEFLGNKNKDKKRNRKD